MMNMQLSPSFGLDIYMVSLDGLATLAAKVNLCWLLHHLERSFLGGIWKSSFFLPRFLVLSINSVNNLLTTSSINGYFFLSITAQLCILSHSGLFSIGC